MTASLNAAGFSSHLASIRDTRKLNAASSNRNEESFSQVLRRTSRDEQPSGPARSRESEKRDSKPGKKDDDANTTAAATANGNGAVVEKSALPITFLFGLSAERLQSFDPQTGSNSASSSQLGGKAGGSNGSAQANSGVFSAVAMAGENGDPLLLMTGPTDLSDFVSPDNAASQKPSASASTGDNSEMAGIGSGGNIAKGAAGALSTNTLAFAMRLGSGEAVSASKATASSAQATFSEASGNAQTNSGVTMPTVIQAASGSALKEKAHEHEPSAQEQNIVDLSSVPSSERFDASKITEDSATAPTAQVPADPPAVATAEPVRNVHMQLVSDDNRRVDVRLIDRGGELHVSVKSADTALTQNLQDHLPDLTARLEKQQMQTEIWVPKAAEPTKADSGNANGSLSDPNARSHSGNSDAGKHGRQQGRPDWVDALESYT